MSPDRICTGTLHYDPKNLSNKDSKFQPLSGHGSFFFSGHHFYFFEFSDFDDDTFFQKQNKLGRIDDTLHYQNRNENYDKR